MPDFAEQSESIRQEYLGQSLFPAMFLAVLARNSEYLAEVPEVGVLYILHVLYRTLQSQVLQVGVS